MTDSYGINYLNTEKSARQQFCQTKYNFLCECEACTNNYQTMMKHEEDLSTDQEAAIKQGIEGVQRLLVSGDPITAISKTKEMFENLTAANVSDDNLNIEKLGIMLGTCLRFQYAL